MNGASALVIDAQAREDLRGTITFDTVGGGRVDFTGTDVNGGVVLRGNLAIVANGGTQDRVISSTSQGLNLDFDTLTLNTADPNSSLLVSSRLWNGGSLIKTGPGTAILTFPNAYTNGTTLSGGTLTIGNNSALGTGMLSMAAGTTLSFLDAGNFVLGNNISIAGDLNFAPPGGTVQTLTGTISDGSTPGTLNMQGPGTLVLTGTSTMARQSG